MKKGCGCVVLIGLGFLLIGALSSTSPPASYSDRTPPAPVDPAEVERAKEAARELAEAEQQQEAEREAEARREQRIGTSGRAVVEAEDIVVKSLKYPDDASFPWFSTNAEYSDKLNCWRVTGKVKAPNGLGLPVTIPWKAAVRKVGAESWKCLLLEIDGEAYIDDGFSAQINAEYEAIQADRRKAEAAADQAAREIAAEQFRQKQEERNAEIAIGAAKARIAHVQRAIEQGNVGPLERKALQRVIDALPADHELHLQALELLKQITD